MKKFIIMLLSLAVISVILISCGNDNGGGTSEGGSSGGESLFSEESTSQNSDTQNSDTQNSDTQNSGTQQSSESGESSEISFTSEDSAEESDVSDESMTESNESADESEAVSQAVSKEESREESKSETSKTEESEPESSVPDESSEDESRKLNDMNGSELLNYAYIESASLESYTANTANELKFTYAGQSGSYIYTAQVKAEGLKGQSPKFSCQSVTNFDGTESAVKNVYFNGYLYREKGTDKIKTAVSASKAKGLLTENIGAAGGLSGGVFKAVKKSASANGGWLVTGSGLVSGSANGIINGLLSSVNLGVDASEVKIESFTVETYINSQGCITLQKVSFVFTMDYSGVTLKFDMGMKTEYTAMGSTKADTSINPGDYTEIK